MVALPFDSRLIRLGENGLDLLRLPDRTARGSAPSSSGMCRISVHCAIAVGSRPATKPKKLRSAERRQLRVPIVSPRFCSVWFRNALTSETVRSANPS